MVRRGGPYGIASPHLYGIIGMLLSSLGVVFLVDGWGRLRIDTGRDDLKTVTGFMSIGIPVTAPTRTVTNSTLATELQALAGSAAAAPGTRAVCRFAFRKRSPRRGGHAGCRL